MDLRAPAVLVAPLVGLLLATCDNPQPAAEPPSGPPPAAAEAGRD